MALTEKILIDKIEIIENNSIQVRTATIIERDNLEISRSFHRHALLVGADVSKEDIKVQKIANVIWTEDVISEFKKAQDDKDI